MEKTRAILAQAEDSREKGLFEKAEEIYEQAIKAAVLAHEFVVASEAHAGRSIMHRRLAKEASTAEESHRMLEQASTDAESAFKFARKLELMGNPGALPLALLAQAKVYAQKGNIEEAIKALEPAMQIKLDDYPEAHRRVSVYIHLKLEYALFKLQNHQDTEAEILSSIDVITDDDGPDSHYNIPVWVSGAYIALAAYWVDTSRQKIDIEKAKHYLTLAEKILSFDDQLILRHRDFDRVQAIVAAAQP